MVGSESLLSPFTVSISGVSTVSGSVTVVPSLEVPASDTSEILSLGSDVSPPATSAVTIAEFSIPPASISL